MKPSGIGGQAVIEGIMMKNKDHYAVAVRKPDKEIIVENREYHSITEKYKFLKAPILRGIVTFVESLIVGMQTLTFSASFYEEEEEAKPSKVEAAMGKVFKQKAEAVLMGATVVLAIVLAMGIFMILPWYLTELLGPKVQGTFLQAAVEGAIRLAIFVLYVFVISLTKDIRRVYMYHGAEHKTINCIENGLELTIANVKKQSKEHKRCGTSFMLYVMIISILFFMFIRVNHPALRIVFRILLVPIIAGISYEFIRLAGNSESKIMAILSRPGMWLQGLTTREPEEDMIEVAIKSVEAVFDWEGYLKDFHSIKIENRNTSFASSFEEESAATKEAITKKAVLKKADKSVRKEPDLADKKETASGEKNVVAVKKATTTRQPLRVIEEFRKETDLLDEEEEDEVLSALDKFFVDEKSKEK